MPWAVSFGSVPFPASSKPVDESPTLGTSPVSSFITPLTHSASSTTCKDLCDRLGPSGSFRLMSLSQDSPPYPHLGIPWPCKLTHPRVLGIFGRPAILSPTPPYSEAWGLSCDSVPLGLRPGAGDHLLTCTRQREHVGAQCLAVVSEHLRLALGATS